MDAVTRSNWFCLSFGAKRERTLDRLIFALGIRFVGEHIARVLVHTLGTLEAIMRASSDQLESIHEIGPNVAKSVEQFFSQKDNREIIKRLQQGGVILSKIEKKSNLTGMTFVFTGMMESFSRSEAQRIVENLGGRAASSVSKNTNFVVIGKNAGSKAEKAKALKIPILSEGEFKDMLEDS